MGKRFGFTLAEVLITLAIIGVVAALTIPTLINNYQEKVTVIKVKKVYSVISQAVQLLVTEYGTIDEWNLSASVPPDRDENGKYLIDNSGMELFAERFFKYIKGDFLELDWQKDYIKSNMLDVPLDEWYTYPEQNTPTAIRLADGTIIEIEFIGPVNQCEINDVSKSGYCLSISATIPNRSNKRSQGINYFNFYVTHDKVVPWGAREDISMNPFDQRCKIGLDTRQNGRGCTGWVIEKGNMDYLHCDGLSWDGKSKCK